MFWELTGFLQILKPDKGLDIVHLLLMIVSWKFFVLVIVSSGNLHYIHEFFLLQILSGIPVTTFPCPTQFGHVVKDVFELSSERVLKALVNSLFSKSSDLLNLIHEIFLIRHQCSRSRLKILSYELVPSRLNSPFNFESLDTIPKILPNYWEFPISSS